MIKKVLRQISNRFSCFKKFYHKLSEYKALLKELQPLQMKYKQNKNLFFLIFTPEYGNLGDHAIAHAEKKLLDDIGVEYVEMTHFQLYRINKHKYWRFFNKKNVLIQGGGFLGSLWLNDEILIRNIVKHSPKATFYLFPSTIYYDATDIGKNEFKKSKKVYNRHKNITFCMREKFSYDIYKNHYKKVKLIPDMVLYLNPDNKKSNRDGCLLCLRNDKEKTISTEQINIVSQQVGISFGKNIKRIDTCTDYNISVRNRIHELDQKLNEFKQAELVVTDRLHGMIFCAITETPCVVINSKSYKVKGCYEWIKHLEYIKFADNVSDINDIFVTIPKKDFTYNNTILKPYYDELKTDIQNILL